MSEITTVTTTINGNIEIPKDLLPNALIVTKKHLQFYSVTCEMCESTLYVKDKGGRGYHCINCKKWSYIDSGQKSKEIPNSILVPGESNNVILVNAPNYPVAFERICCPTCTSVIDYQQKSFPQECLICGLKFTKKINPENVIRYGRLNEKGEPIFVSNCY